MLETVSDIDLTLSKADILSAHQVGTWQWDIVNDRITCDKTNAGLLGLTREEASRGVRLQRMFEAVHPEDRERFRASTAPARESGGTVDLVIRTTPAPGVVRHVNVRGRYEPDDRGIMVRGYGLLIDLADGPPAAVPSGVAPESVSDDPISRSAELCRSARRVIAESGSFRLRTLLDMVLLEYDQLVAREAKSPPGLADLTSARRVGDRKRPS